MNNLIRMEQGTAVLDPEVAFKIAEFEKAVKEIKAKEDELKKKILEEMEAENILRLETEEILISYVTGTDRETLDSKALKAELPDVYDSYVKFTPVKSSIRIKVK
jgi:regulator of replication initiation timing